MEQWRSYSTLLITVNLRILFAGWGDIFFTSPVSAGILQSQGSFDLAPFDPAVKPKHVSRKPTGRWNQLEKKDCQMILNLSGEMWRVLLWGIFIQQQNVSLLWPLYISSCLFSAPSLTIHVQMLSVTLPTPQPTDDVDIYFETPADDKEHSRFQRAKEQLEIRHRSRMERVRVSFQNSVCCWM